MLPNIPGLEGLDLSHRCGPELSDPDEGGFELERVGLDAQGRVPVDLRPPELKTFVEANWAALVAEAERDRSARDQPDRSR